MIWLAIGLRGRRTCGKHPELWDSSSRHVQLRHETTLNATALQTILGGSRLFGVVTEPSKGISANSPKVSQLRERRLTEDTLSRRT
jgi:hypothetical protein